LKPLFSSSHQTIILGNAQTQGQLIISLLTKLMQTAVAASNSMNLHCHELAEEDKLKSLIFSAAFTVGLK